MRRRNLAIGLAALAIIGLALAIWLRPRGGGNPAGRPLFARAPAAMTQLRARWASGDRLLLRRRAGRWRILQPVRAPADPTRIRAFLAALSEPVSSSYPATRIAPADAGLAPPRLVVAAGDGSASFGRINPATGLRYVRRGNTVFTVADTILPRLAAGVWQFVDPRLLPRGARVTGVRLPGARTRAAPALAGAWQSAVAERVGPPAGRTAPSAGTVAVALAGASATRRFTIRSRRPKLRLDRPGAGVEYILPAAAASRLLPTASAPGARTPGG